MSCNNSLKNSHEIRMDLLKMSYDYLDKIQTINNDIATKTFKDAVKLGTLTYSDWKEYASKPFNMDDVIEKARELQKFVFSSQ